MPCGEERGRGCSHAPFLTNSACRPLPSTSIHTQRATTRNYTVRPYTVCAGVLVCVCVSVSLCVCVCHTSDSCQVISITTDCVLSMWINEESDNTQNRPAASFSAPVLYFLHLYCPTQIVLFLTPPENQQFQTVARQISTVPAAGILSQKQTGGNYLHHTTDRTSLYQAPR